MIPDIHKTVIVTGASQGIGAGLVKAFLDRRYNVVQRDGQFIHPIAGEAPRLDQVIENRMSSETKAVSGYCQKGIK